MKYYDVPLQGKKVVVVGRSKTVGAPVAQLLINQNATVTTCHSRTVDLPGECKKAEILVVAIGKREFITTEYLNKNCVVVDVGIHYDDEGKMCGDVSRATYNFLETYSPVPRGVGPLTNIALMQNLLLAKEM
jgi:methylenetetrahydrofolate dehydrogenase (NADP+)/methenyltetrahydrofolate cyclohydrolase